MTESEEEIIHTEDDEDFYDLERLSIIHLDYRYNNIGFKMNFNKLKLINFRRVMWIRDKVMKFLGIPGYELQFYKLLNVNMATMRL